MGYFYKIWASDVFVFLDNVQFSKQGYTSSTWTRKNLHSTERFKLTVPVKKSNLDTEIKDIFIHGDHWSKKHFKHLKQTYKKAPFYNETIELLDVIFSEISRFEKLSELNIYIITEILKHLKLKPTIILSSDTDSSLKSSHLLVEIMKENAGNIYLAGVGSQKYQKDELFLNQGIKIHKIDFYNLMEKYKYPRTEVEFINGLSILDALFCIGRIAVLSLFDRMENDLNMN